MAAPILNMHLIPANMYPGRMIRVKGSVPPDANRFTINLQCGPHMYPHEEIAFHLAIYPELCIVRNTFTGNKWGVEEKDGGMPMKKGDQFEVSILCETDSFKVALNGVHFGQFRHRIPFLKISHLTVDGEVTLQLISIDGAQPGGSGGPQQMYTVTTDEPSIDERFNKGAF